MSGGKSIRKFQAWQYSENGLSRWLNHVHLWIVRLRAFQAESDYRMQGLHEGCLNFVVISEPNKS